MPNSNDNVVVKKIKAYPIEAQISKDAVNIKAQILKIVMHGFMADLGTAVVKVGDIHQLTFTFPTEKISCLCQIKVIKTYDKYLNVEAPTKATRLAEFHFLQMSEDLKKKIKHFLKTIKQVGTDLV